MVALAKKTETALNLHVIASGLGNPEVDLGMQNLNPEVSLGIQNLDPEVDRGMKEVKAFEKQECEVSLGCQTFRLQITNNCLLFMN